MAISLAVRIKAYDFDMLCEEMASDISLGGVFLRTENPRDLNTRVTLAIDLQGEGQTVRCQGTVVRVVSPEQARERGETPGMAIAFTGFGDGDEDVLCRLLARRERERRWRSGER